MDLGKQVGEYGGYRRRAGAGWRMYTSMEGYAMTQTLREKLMLIVEAVDAGEPCIDGGSYVIPIDAMWRHTTLTRIPKPPETISGTYADGTKWEINAPMREAPADGVNYFHARLTGGTESITWYGDAFDKLILDDCNCWRTKADAQAWADVSRRLRGGV